MKKKVTKIILIIVAILVVLSLPFIHITISKKNEKISNIEGNKYFDEENTESIKTQEEIENEKYNKMLSEMTLEEKIGQMLFISSEKNVYDQELKELMNKVKPGGFILMGNNISTYEGTLNFVKSLQKDAKITMLIGIDQEGGSVQRLKKLTDVRVSQIPFMYNLGLTNDTSLAYSVGKVVATELRTIGVNLDFSPSLDIYSNKENTVIGKRAFGTSAEVVSKMALPFANGLKDNMVMECYKQIKNIK